MNKILTKIKYCIYFLCIAVILMAILFIIKKDTEFTKHKEVQIDKVYFVTKINH